TECQHQDGNQFCCGKTRDAKPRDHISPRFLPALLKTRSNYLICATLVVGRHRISCGECVRKMLAERKSKFEAGLGGSSRCYTRRRNEGFALLAFPEIANSSDRLAVGDKSGNRIHHRAASSIL